MDGLGIGSIIVLFIMGSTLYHYIGVLVAVIWCNNSSYWEEIAKYDEEKRERLGDKYNENIIDLTPYEKYKMFWITLFFWPIAIVGSFVALPITLATYIIITIHELLFKKIYKLATKQDAPVIKSKRDEWSFLHPNEENKNQEAATT